MADGPGAQEEDEDFLCAPSIYLFLHPARGVASCKLWLIPHCRNHSVQKALEVL